MARSDKLLVGVILAPHGVKGWVKVKSLTQRPESVAAYGPLSDESGRRRFELTPVGSAKGGILARIAGIEDRNAAEALKGLRLYIERSALPANTEPDSFYIADLIGLAVEDRAGRRLGAVKAVMNYGAGEVLEIALDDGNSLLLTFTDRNVPEVDLAGGRLVVDPPVEAPVGPEEGPAAGKAAAPDETPDLAPEPRSNEGLDRHG